MDVNDIKKLIDRGKLSEAKKMLSEYLEQTKLSSNEVGKTYAEFASLYVKVMNQILENYKSLQETVVQELRDLKMKEKIITE